MYDTGLEANILGHLNPVDNNRSDVISQNKISLEPQFHQLILGNKRKEASRLF